MGKRCLLSTGVLWPYPSIRVPIAVDFGNVAVRQVMSKGGHRQRRCPDTLQHGE